MNYRDLHINALKSFFSRAMLLSFLLFLNASAFGQEEAAAEQEKEKGRYLKVSGSMQFWLRYASLNPGSQIMNREQTWTWDLFIRRYRLRVKGNATDKLSYHLEIGNNDVSFYNPDRSLPHLLDAYVDYQVLPHLAFGVGKQSWAGPTRYSAPSTTQGLAYDIDFIGAPFVNVYDDILRRMGVYARGTYEGFDYRLVLAKPSFFGQSSIRTIGVDAGFSDQAPEYQFSIYIKYQFWEQESQNSPYAAGTYLGRRNILNLGFGTLQQPNTTWYLNGNDTIYHDASSLAADVFLEHSLPKNRGITLYAAYVYHNLGRNFMRYMGANNPATSALPTEFVNGRGNNAPVIGTGHVWYMQLGFVCPADGRNQTQLQPYASMQYSRFQALDDPVLIYNAGFGYFLNGTRSKITFGYQSRPVFKQTEYLVSEGMRKGMLVLQYQILFGS